MDFPFSLALLLQFFHKTQRTPEEIIPQKQEGPAERLSKATRSD